MTDTSSIAVTHPATEPYPVAAPLRSPALNGAISDSAAPEEEEPYTIKCICAFEDDDGNTVFCEGCETWQHIECYYEGNAVPEVHNCVDCEPRPLDGEKATLRQIHLRREGGDQKSKRSGSKGHKKKSKERKDVHDQVNGFHSRSDSGARDQPPAKRPKTSHRSSGSVPSLAGPLSLAPDGRKRTSSSSMSPTKSSTPSIPLYSNEFMHLYERDQGHADMNSNLFVNLPLAADLASWVTEPSALARVANGRSAQDIFTWSDDDLYRSRWPTLSTESIADPSIEIEGKHPTWKILKTQGNIHKDEIVGEIKGKIGLLRDYCLDPSNRWQELRHPEPFVFFHPQLPIYIDSRHEGSQLRYVRRSCRPNVTMKTYITNEVEYHFCFVAKEDIPANSEITAMWYLDPQLFESTNGLVKQESSDSAQEVAAVCISNVLSHFGGCACAPPANCLLASVDRRRHPKAPETKQSNGRRKKAKSKPNISPLGIHNRAGSEGTKNADDDDPADSRSASGSARGQTRSRDLTPTTQHPNDPPLFGEPELSAREKRKIAAAEKKFQQLEQDQQASHKKKKRSGAHSAQTTPTIGPGQGGYFGHQSTAGRHSYSPPSAMSPPLSGARQASPRKTSNPNVPTVRSPLGRPQYVHSAIQTEPDASDMPSTPSPGVSSFTPLTARLMKRFQFDRVRFEDSKRPPGPLSPTTVGQRSHLSSPNASAQDIEMKDANSPATTSRRRESEDSSAQSRAELSPQASGLGKPPLPPPWPSTAAHNSRLPRKSDGNRSDHQATSPTQGVTSPGSAVPSTASPPSSADPSQGVQGSSISAPSPVKKKLSLGDYLIWRGTMSAPSDKSPGQATGMPPPQKSPSGAPPAGNDRPSPMGNPQAKSPGEENGGNSPDGAAKDVPGPTPTSAAPSSFPF